jgi:hypothetical protein
MDTYPPAVQRPALLRFAEAIGSRADALRRDECGDWRIKGRLGHVYAVPGSIERPKTPGFQLMVMTLSSRGWTEAKRGLAFAQITQDGDDEGALFLDRLPTPIEGAVIRAKLNIFKRAVFSEETLAQKRKWASMSRGLIDRRSPKSGPEDER